MLSFPVSSTKASILPNCALHFLDVPLSEEALS